MEEWIQIHTLIEKYEEIIKQDESVYELLISREDYQSAEPLQAKIKTLKMVVQDLKKIIS